MLGPYRIRELTIPFELFELLRYTERAFQACLHVLVKGSLYAATASLKHLVEKVASEQPVKVLAAMAAAPEDP
eukprot:4930582-Amphidinium_carterae.1